jgi:fumarate hydratase class I
LNNGVIYHCGPILKYENNNYIVNSAGPTTSMREEIYMPYIIKQYGLRAVIGKGGMGKSTLNAMKEYNCVYLHAVGGSAVKTAQWIKNVVDVKKKEFGTPEAIWLLYVEDFTAYVTMDSYGNSLHDNVKLKSKEIYNSFSW